MDLYETLTEIISRELPAAQAAALDATAHRGDLSGWRDVAALLRDGAAIAEQLADGDAR